MSKAASFVGFVPLQGIYRKNNAPIAKLFRSKINAYPSIDATAAEHCGNIPSCDGALFSDSPFGETFKCSTEVESEPKDSESLYP